MPDSLENVSGVRRKPIQKRGQASLDRLLDATEELLLLRRFDDIPISDIVEKANSSVGVFYARFRNKADILFALQQRELETSAKFTDDLLHEEFWGTIPLYTVIQHAVSATVDHYRRRRHVLAAIAGLELSRPELYAHDNPLRKALKEGVSAILANWKRDFSHPDPDAAILMGIAFVFSFLEHLVAFDGHGSYGAYGLDDPRLKQELVRMLSHYVGVPDMPKDF